MQQTRSAVRGFFGLPRWTPTSPLFHQLQLPTLEDTFLAKLAVFVRRCVVGRTSPLFGQYFARVAGDRTRGAAQHLLQVPFWPGPAGRATIQFVGAVLWNKLPADLRCETSHAQFCALVKAHYSSV